MAAWNIPAQEGGFCWLSSGSTRRVAALGLSCHTASASVDAALMMMGLGQMDTLVILPPPRRR